MYIIICKIDINILSLLYKMKFVFEIELLNILFMSTSFQLFSLLLYDSIAFSSDLPCYLVRLCYSVGNVVSSTEFYIYLQSFNNTYIYAILIPIF